MYSWLLSVYFYFPLLVSCLKFWCCFAKEGIIKVPYKLFPINSFQGQARKRGEKRKKLMWKRCLCLLLCAIYPLTCMEGLAGFKTLDHISAVPFPGLFALGREWQWDALSQLFSCNRFQIIVKISSCQSIYPFKCVLCCVLGLPCMDCSGRTHCLPVELNHPELPSPLAENILHKVLPPPCLNQADVFPWWHEFCLVTFWLLVLVFSILNLLSECTWKVFSLFVSVFMALGCSFCSSPSLLLSLSAVTNNIPSLFKKNMKVKCWHSLYHEIKSAANPVSQKSGCARGGS